MCVKNNMRLETSRHNTVKGRSSHFLRFPKYGNKIINTENVL